MRSFNRITGKGIIILMLAAFSFSIYAAAGLTLNGHFVPKDSFMLFIGMGNSAMSGRDKSPDLVTDPHLWKFEMSPAKYDWLPAEEPICVDARNTLSAPLGGPIMPFLKSLLALYPGYYFGVMQLSNSAWELQGHFNAGAAEVNALLTQANGMKANVTIAGIISMLNIVEVQNSDTANYTQKVADMVSNIRTSLGLPYTVPYIHAGYPVLAGSSTSAQYDTSLAQTKSIIRQIAQIPGKVTNCVIIPTDSCAICFNCTPSGYYSHYDRSGNLKWGGRAADSVKARGMIPPPFTGIRNSSCQAYRTSGFFSPVLHKILFNGSNWSVFEKSGKPVSIYAPNGKMIPALSNGSLKNRNLLPGVYFVRSEVKN
jgi:hypothetical protein